MTYNKAMKTPKRILSVILFIIACICLLAAVYFGVRSILDDRHAAQVLEELRPADTNPEGTAADSSEDPAASTQGQESNAAEASRADASAAAESDGAAESTAASREAPAVVNPYRDSFLANSHMAGWLRIPGTNIDYPVMWTPEDENYYLYRTFDKSENQNGSLILDTDSSLDPLTTNLIIHGHNMRSGEMFGDLTDYESEAYYQEHKRMILYTKECQRNYEIVAVFRSQVYKKSQTDVFKFYKFFQANTEEEFDDFYQNIKELSLYDTGVTAQFGDHFITLSTCVYHVEQGRFVVVAREIEPGDSYLPIEENGESE